MAQRPYFKVKTIPGKKSNFFLNPNKKRKHKQLIFSVIGVYLIVGSLLAGFLFSNQKGGPADADELAGITTSIRFVEEKPFSIGEKVQILLTLQNTSVIESINNLSAEVLSTKEAVKWEKAVNPNVKSAVPIAPVRGNNFSLPVLSPGERLQYMVEGSLKDNTVDYLTVLSRLRYSTTKGTQTINTNRIFTGLNGDIGLARQPLLLQPAKESFIPGEDVVLTLTKNTPEFEPLEKGFEGDVHISNRNTGESIGTFDCNVGDDGICQVGLQNLPSGSYSALFTSGDQKLYSKISWFEVQGETTTGILTPNSQSSLETPFGAKSINGLVPIIATRVISKNENPSTSPACSFEITKDGQEVTKVNTAVDSDRTCRAIISINQLKGEGVYKIKLAQTNLEKEVSFLPEGKGLLNIQNAVEKPQKGQELDLKIENIVDGENKAIAAENINLYIYHHTSGLLQEITNIQGNRLQVKDGKFNIILPGSYFESSGFYMIFAQMEKGLQSTFLNLSFSDTELAFSESGVIVSDYGKLRTDQDVNFKLAGVSDRDGNLVANGDCLANIYTPTSGITPITISGQIINGNCEVAMGAGTVTKSGPVLVSFTGNNTNGINQSRSFSITAGAPVSFGSLNLEYEPAVKNYANNLTIGPVVDKFGNLADSFNHRVVVFNDKQEVVKEFTNINIKQGFAEVLIPSSLIGSDQISVSLQNSEGAEIIKRDFVIFEPEDKLILPNIPSELKSEDNLKLSLSNLTFTEPQMCKFRFSRTLDSYIEEEVEYDAEKKICEIDWDLAELRDNPKALVQISIGTKQFTKIVDLIDGEATNVFVTEPQIRFNEQKELEISLLTSPILDKQGLPVTKGEVKWTYNGKIEKTAIENGFAKLNIIARNLEARDIQQNFDKRFLDLDLDVQASTTSISRTNNLNIFLGKFDIANTLSDFGIKDGANYVSTQYSKIFAFRSSSCNALTVFNNQSSQITLTHRQGNSCFVEANGDIGKNQLLFEDNGFTIGKFSFLVGESRQEIEWCKNEGNKCSLIQVLEPVNSKVEAIIYDGEKQYQFASQELENTITLSQNGLNPLKEYLVEIRYTNLDNQVISHYKEILGERLITEE